MKKIKIFKSGFGEKLKLLLIPIGLLIGSFTMHAWAGSWYSNDMWNVWGWKTGYGGDGWLKEGLDSGEDYDLGVISTDEYYIKGLGAFTNGGDVTFVRCYFTYPDATNSNAYLNDYTNKWGGGDNPERYWEKKSIWNYHISSTTHSVGDHAIQIYFKLGYSDNSEQSQNHRQIKWTIPGFATSSTSRDFGSSIPVNTESETKIDVRHYGDWPTLGGCVLSGTNPGDFEVIDIDYTGVKVLFKPTTTGHKTATLTITDTYDKTCTITLTGTAVAAGTTTRLYFNNYNYNSNWTYGSASSRFTVEYTSGVYTYFPMTQCANSSYNYYADVEIKEAAVSVDRYNASTHEYYNTASITGINASNPYAVLDNLEGGIFYGFATNHPYNDVSGGNIYYDNSKSGLTNTIYLVIGHDYKMSGGGTDDEYSKVHALGNIPNTKLYYGTFADTWHDADYYAFIGASSAPSEGKWGSDDLSSKASSSSYTGIYRDIMDLESGSSYLGYAATKTNGALSMTKSPTLNTTQTFNYELSTDGGSSFNTMTSGSPNTPGKLSMATYEFANVACTTVVAKSAQELAANATTYSKAVSSVALTAATTLTASEKRDGYTFVGWYEGSTLATASAGTTSVTYYPNANKTLTARYKAHRYTIAFDNNDTQYSSAPAATGEMSSITNVVYDQSATLIENGFEREGYEFAGWNTEADGSGTPYSNEASVSNLTSTDGATVTLYAQWTEDLHDVTVQYRYGEEEIKTDGSISGVGITTTQDAVAPSITGYDFTTWSDMPSGVTKVSGDLDDETITINATADDKTITANYTPKEYSGTVDKTTGTTDGTYSVTFKTTSLSASGMAKAGYHVDGYYLTYSAGTYDVYIADKDGNLQENKSISTTQYTNGDNEWIYDGNPTIYAHWAANTYTLRLMRNDGTDTYEDISVTMGASDYTDRSTQVRPGYTFDGYYTSGGTKIFASNLGIVISANEEIEEVTIDYTDANGRWIYPNHITLYAHWTPVALTTSGSGNAWGTAANWSPACVPTIEHDVTINDEVTVSDAAAAKNIAFGEDGKLNIESTGALEVAGTITNTDASKINVAARGALIFDNSAGTTQATVELSLNSSRWQMIAIPVGYVNVSDAFVGSSVYTYVWKYGEGWERRGYYDGLAAFESVLIKGSAGKTFTGALVSTADKSFTASYDDSKVSGDVTMYGNSWPAPIAISRMDLTATADGAVHVFTGSGWEGGTISDYIPALQGYAVIAKSTGGTVKIPYSAVRAVPAANRNTALRAPKRTTSDIFDHITIYVSGNEWQTRIRLYENEQFSDEIDKGYEALYMEGEGIAGELYAQAAEKMNVLAVPDLEGTVVGFVPGQATSYTLSFEGDGRGYYLNDVETKKSTLIAEGNTYTFSRSDNDASRFIISRTPIQNLPTGVGNINDGAQARKVLIDNKIYIIRGGRMYDATGALVK